MTTEHPQGAPDSNVGGENSDPFAFIMVDTETLADRAVALVRSMAAIKCRNRFPVGVIGHVARAHYIEARHIASAMSAGTAETQDAAQGEARQRGPQSGDAQVSEQSS